jgi:hypothetical protein
LVSAGTSGSVARVSWKRSTNRAQCACGRRERLMQ